MQENGFEKRKYLQNKLIREGLILGGVCGLLVLLASGVAWYSTMTMQDRDALQAENGSLSVANQTMQANLNKAKESLTLYKAIFERNPKDGMLDRELGAQLLNQFKERYRISRLDFSIPPVEELVDARFKNASVAVVSSQVSLNLEGMTDEYIFKFINALMREFPGYVRITKMNVTRQGDLNDDALRLLVDKQTPGLVRCDLVFQWMGLKYLAPAGAAPGTEAPPPATPPGT